MAEGVHIKAQEQQQRQPYPPMVAFVVDAASALITSSIYTTVFYPFHRVKVLLQTQDSNPQIASGVVKRYNFAHSFARIAREGGIQALWHGNVPYMLRHVPSTTLSFTFNDFFKRHLPQYDPKDQLYHSMATNLLAGGLAGGLALGLVYPMDFATIRMAADLGPLRKDQGLVETFLAARRRGGILALYQGFGVSLVAISAYKALYFGLYETAKGTLFADSSATDNSSQAFSSRVLQKWLVASGLVSLATTVTYPLDIVRKRLVVDSSLPQRQYAGFMDCVRKVAQKEGLAGFYRFYGYDMLLRLGGGVLLVMYDEIKHASHAAVQKVSQK